MKKFLIALSVMMIFFAASASAQSVRLARLPIIFQCKLPDSDTCAELETKIERAVHIPLNGTLQLADYLDPKNSAIQFNDIWQNLRAQNKKARLTDVMRPLAEKLDADIIVCPVLKDFSQHVFSVCCGETVLISHARAELIVYDRRTDELIDKKSSLFHNDVYHPRGTAEQLTKECFDKIIDASKLRQKIHDIR